MVSAVKSGTMSPKRSVGILNDVSFDLIKQPLITTFLKGVALVLTSKRTSAWNVKTGTERDISVVLKRSQVCQIAKLRESDQTFQINSVFY